MPASSTSSHIIKLKFENNYLTPCISHITQLSSKNDDSSPRYNVIITQHNLKN